MKEAPAVAPAQLVNGRKEEEEEEIDDDEETALRLAEVIVLVFREHLLENYALLLSQIEVNVVPVTLLIKKTGLNAIVMCILSCR